MPSASLRPCATAHCPTLVVKGHCAVHARAKEHQRYNAEARKWYRTEDWKRLRLLVLGEEPICMNCKRSASSEVDHKTPHRGSYVLFWDRDNLQGLCKPCHSRKTQRGE